MKSVLITFDQAYSNESWRCSTVWVVVALHTLKKYKDVVRKQRSAFRKPCLAKYVLGYPDSVEDNKVDSLLDTLHKRICRRNN